MLTRLVTAFCLLLSSCSVLQAQAKYTAERTGDLQIGVEFVGGTSSYLQGNLNLKGAGFYTTFDLTNHLGAEFDLRQGNSSQQDVYERTYEIGARYFRSYGRITPWGRVTMGRGIFNFPNDAANLAYNMIGFGGGADLRVTRYLNLRGEYEYQRWFSFPPSGLNPQIFSGGVAYHFPGGLRRGRHY